MISSDKENNFQDGIAVVGMSCRFPGSNNIDEFWEILVSGTDPIAKAPFNRTFHHEKRKGLQEFEAGFLKCPVDEFDAKFFGISPREALFVDPQQRLLLEVIWESLENGCINPESLHGSNTGVFVGIWQQDYDKLIPNGGLQDSDSHYRYVGNAFSATASRISHFLGLFGPNYSIESGCASSSAGIHLACQSLCRGETDLSIATGVNLILNQKNPMGGGDFINSEVLSKEFRCKTFDARADGFARAEGCGAVVLKRFVDAIRDGDNILGQILGTALNNDGPGTSFGTPNPVAQQRVIREALANARVEPHQVSLIEAHGTGTKVGDPLEMNAIAGVYSANRKAPLLISSVKTNIGHSESCAGMAGFIKLLLCFKHKMVPPHLHLTTLNPNIDLDSIPAEIPTKQTLWNQPIRIASMSSFSMSGTNVHIIIQEPPKPTAPIEPPKSLFPVVISAKSEGALESLRQAYISFLKTNADNVELSDFSFSLATGRANLKHRIGLAAKNTHHLIDCLQRGSYESGIVPRVTQIIFLFTGQGSQYLGMAKNLYKESSIFRSAFSHMDSLFQKYLNTRLPNVVWEDSTLLEQTIYSQPALFCIQVCLVEFWRSFGVLPDTVLGHSVGEFCAAVCAGILSVEDGFKLVSARGKLVAALPVGKMLALKTSPATARALISAFTESAGGWIDVAAENSDLEVVVSGSVGCVDSFASFLQGRDVKFQEIQATHAFHSRQMDSVLEEYGNIASTVGYSGKLCCKYVSGTLGKIMRDGDFNASYWQRHLRDTVKFQKATSWLWKSTTEGARVVVEIGPQPILCSLAMANKFADEEQRSVFCPSLRRSQDNITSVLTSVIKMYVSGVQISWNEWYPPGQHHKLALPTYPFQRQKYWYVPNETPHVEMHDTLPCLHPLLGREVTSAGSETIFDQVLKIPNLPYLAHHRVANRTIFPFAGFLELMLVAGREAIDGSRKNPFQIDNFSVPAALEFTTKPCQVQTIVRSLIGQDSSTYQVSIHGRKVSKKPGSWKRHAFCNMSLATPSTPPQLNISEIRLRTSPIENVASGYDHLASSGLQLDAPFRSISSGWVSQTEFLAELIEVENSAAEYILHPIYLDAMLQLVVCKLAWTSTESLRLALPVGIRKFTWLSSDVNGGKLYAHARSTADDETVTLFTEGGRVLAIVEGIEFCQTTADNFLRGLDSTKLPGFTEEIWRHYEDCATSPVPTVGLDGMKSWYFASDGGQVGELLRQKVEQSGNCVVIEDAQASSQMLAGVVYFLMASEEFSHVDPSGCKELLTLCQTLLQRYDEVKVKPQVTLVTRSIHTLLGNDGAGDPNVSAAIGLLKTFSNENPAFNVKMIDLDLDERDPCADAEIVFNQMMTFDSEPVVGVRQQQIFVPRLVGVNPKRTLPLPKSSRFKIYRPESRTMTDLQISPSPKLPPMGSQIEVTVRSVALNFRDLFMILQPEGFVLPDWAEKDPGLDVSGIISHLGPTCTKFKVGDEVFGFTNGGGMSSHILIDESNLMLKPSWQTFNSASTIPVPFLTVLHAFFDCAQIKAGDKVLIHVATGGVGLAAIQVAKEAKAEIYATAGSRRKRTYLRSLGIQNIYNSRNISFGEEILKDTDGAGVNIVLNSLTAPNFKEASLKACAPAARFVEIGKVNIWTEEEVKALRPDVSYFVIDLSTLAYEDPNWHSKTVEVLESQLAKRIYATLPYESFPLELVREAFQYLQEAKHIGKVVVTMPEVSISNTVRITFFQPLFYAQSTYVITGGLGGIGLQVTKWMHEKGARNIVLVGRSSPSSDAATVISNLNQNGCSVFAVLADVGDLRDCQLLLESIHSLYLPPLGGIMHAAGVLSDAIVVNQSWESFENVFRPKVSGTWNLHKVTLGLSLEFFALYSSIVAVMGLKGQSNYAAANAFMDSFAHYRRSLGLPAMTMNFGAWSEVGLEANSFTINTSRYSTILSSGLKHFSPKQGISAIEKIFQERRPQTIVSDISNLAILRDSLKLGNFFNDMVPVLGVCDDKHATIPLFTSSLDPLVRKSSVEKYVESVLRETLHIPKSENLGPEQNFSEIGIDSLMAMELRNRLQKALSGKQLTLVAIQENRTIRALAGHILKVMDSETVDMNVQIQTMVLADSILPKEIQLASIPATNPSHFKEILLTGATGHLGIHFIQSIQNLISNSTIYCIVRSKNTQDAKMRLTKTLSLYNMLDTVKMDTLVILSGDLNKENFGLEPQTYRELCSRIDAVVHCAAKTNHVESYAAEGENSIRSQNVLTTINVLKFATSLKTKHVLYTSSIVASTEADSEGKMYEGFPGAEDSGQKLGNGYSLTKFVSEKLMGQALERGLPVTVFRYPCVLGNSLTGHFPLETDHAWAVIQSSFRIGMLPEVFVNKLPFIPVDTATDISTKILFQDFSELGVYNFTGGCFTFDDIKEVFGKFGVATRLVTFPTWREAVFANMSDNVLAPFSSLYLENPEVEYPTFGAQLFASGAQLMSQLSDKIKRNYEGVESKVIPIKKLLQQHLKAHLE